MGLWACQGGLPSYRYEMFDVNVRQGNREHWNLAHFYTPRGR